MVTGATPTRFKDNFIELKGGYRPVIVCEGASQHRYGALPKYISYNSTP